MNSTKEKIARAIETKNVPEIYDAYAVWISQNRWAWLTGGYPAKQSFDTCTRINGLEAFLNSNYNFNTEKDVKDLASNCSTYFRTYPEQIKIHAHNFTQTFPNVIKDKINKKKRNEKKQENLLNKNLNSLLNIAEQNTSVSDNEVQTEICFESTKTSIASDLITTVGAFAKYGAKSVETPDGWKIHF